MSPQLILVALIVAAAVAYLGWTSWRTWRGRKAGCGGGCACPGAAQRPQSAPGNRLIPPSQLTLRRRGADNP